MYVYVYVYVYVCVCVCVCIYVSSSLLWLTGYKAYGAQNSRTEGAV